MFNSELLHFVDPNLANIFQPLQLLLAPLGKLQCHFNGNRVRVPTACYRYYTVACLIFVTLLYVASISMLYLNNSGSHVNQTLLISVYFLVFIVTVARIMITNKDGKIIQLIFEIQEIDRHLCLPKSEEYYGSYRKKNIVWVCGLIAFHLTFWILELSTAVMFSFFTPLLTLTRLVIDSELVNFMGYIDVINSRLNHLNGLLEYKGHPPEPTAERIVTERDVDIVTCYKKIVYAIKLSNKIWSSQLLVLFSGEFYLITRSMVLQLRYIRYLNYGGNPLVGVMNCAFLFRHILVFLVPCIRAQELANLLETTTTCCGTVLNSNVHELHRKACKCILLLHRAIDPALRLADMDSLRVDGRWPLRVLATFAACIVVILQLGINES